MSDLEPDIKAALALLQYDPIWLEYKFLTPSDLHEQAAYFHGSDDKSTEHYRYYMFRRILNSRETMSDEEISRYIDLTQRDKDLTMATSALYDLVLWSGLTPQQFDRLGQSPFFADSGLQRRILRRRLITELKEQPLTPELFQRCLASEDTQFQVWLLHNVELTREQAQVLAEQGKTRAIRNIAAQAAKRNRTVSRGEKQREP